MRGLTIIAALAALTSAHPTTAPRDRGFGCGTNPTEDFKAVALAMKEKEAKDAAEGVVSIAATINIQTYFHVVASSTSLSGGYITDTMLSNQLAVMNSNFAPYGISFTLAGTDKTVNSAWASDGNELAMKKALRKGDYKALNIYFMKEIGGNFGYCYFPTTVTTGSNNFYYDGCSILYTTVPGGSATNYNEGKTVTHEVGHWFGLYHTFQGNSCSGSGDSIADTPQQLSATSGCPEGRDSCPNVSGLDPIHNYMDYSYDSCYTEFTANQATRMANMYNTYRA